MSSEAVAMVARLDALGTSSNVRTRTAGRMAVVVAAVAGAAIWLLDVYFVLRLVRSP